MWLLFWCFLFSYIASALVKRAYPSLPGSVGMIFIVNLSGGVIFPSALGMGFNFWKSSIINFPSISAILLGITSYLVLWLVACQKFAVEDMSKQEPMVTFVRVSNQPAQVIQGVDKVLNTEKN